jgi:putative inorganic carbon (HCO3(-)) transporter
MTGDYNNISLRENILRILDPLILFCFTYTILTAQCAPKISYLSLMILTVLFVIRSAHERSFEAPEKIIVMFIVSFLVVQFISSLMSVDPRQSITVMKIRVYYYAMFFISILYIKTMEQVRAVLAAIILFTSILSLIEVCRFIFDLNSMDLTPTQMRIGYYIHPVTSAEIKMFVVLIILPFLLIKENFILPKKWLLILLTPIFISFMFDYARGAFIALFIGVIIIGALKNRKIIYVTIAFLIFYFLVLPDSVNQRIATLKNPDDKSVMARKYMFETGVQIAKDNFLIGVGSIDLKQTYEKYRKITIWAEGEQLHNNLLQLVVTTGIFGLLIWLAMMLYIFRRQIEIYRQTKGNNVLNALALTSLVSMVVFQICGLTDWNFADYSVVSFLWLTVSVAFIAQKFMSDTSAQAAPK